MAEPGGDFVDATAEAEERAAKRGKAIVAVRSSGEPVIVAKVLDRTVGAGYAAGHTVIVAGMSYRDLCTSPCTLRLDPGIHELLVYSEEVPSTANKFELRSGTHKLDVSPGSSGLVAGGYLLTALGLGALVLGGTFAALDSESHGWALPTALGGVAGTFAGIWMLMEGATSLEHVYGPGRRVGGTRSLSFGYRAAL